MYNVCYDEQICHDNRFRPSICDDLDNGSFFREQFCHIPERRDPSHKACDHDTGDRQTQVIFNFLSYACHINSAAQRLRCGLVTRRGEP